jgi:3-(3-hydroxy-phenyl)propionate hydroxylase
MLDAIIVGLGTTGATLANLLAQRGWNVVAIERRQEIYDKPRAITADQEAMRVFQEIGLADEIEATTVPHPGTDFLGVDGKLIKKFYPAEPPRLLGWEPSFMFLQPELEAILRKGCARFSNLDIRLSCELLRLTHADNHVAVDVQDAQTGATETIRARYVLGADGGSSTVRRLLGATFDDLTFDEEWLVVDALITDETEFPARLIQYCRPSRPGTYIVGPGSLRRWEIKLLPGEGPSDYEDVQSVIEILAEFTGVDDLEIIRRAVYRFHAVVAHRWRYDRVFLLGDAAHQMPPFLGQGMCAGIRDTVNLAWKLDAVLRGHASGALLDTYEMERKPHVRTIVEHAKEFGLIIGELDADAALERDRRLTRQLQEGTVESIRQSFIPGLVDGLIARGEPLGKFAPGAGALFPQPRVMSEDHGETVLLDHLLPAGFALVTFEGSDWADCELVTKGSVLSGPQVDVRSAPTSEGAGNGRIVVTDVDGVLVAWANSLSAAVAIVRPDRYVYGTATTHEEFIELVGSLRDKLGLTRRTTGPHAGVRRPLSYAASESTAADEGMIG